MSNNLNAKMLEGLRAIYGDDVVMVIPDPAPVTDEVKELENALIMQEVAERWQTDTNLYEVHQMLIKIGREDIYYADHCPDLFELAKEMRRAALAKFEASHV